MGSGRRYVDDNILGDHGVGLVLEDFEGHYNLRVVKYLISKVLEEVEGCLIVVFSVD